MSAARVETDRALTLSTFAALAVIVDAASNGSKVVRMVEGGDAMVYGIARHLVVDTGGGFLLPTDDIRDAFLRVTSKTGAEHFWPVSELVKLAKRHQFSVYDW